MKKLVLIIRSLQSFKDIKTVESDKQCSPEYAFVALHILNFLVFFHVVYTSFSFFVWFQIALQISLNDARTGCEDLDSLFSVVDNDCPSLSVRGCRVNAVEGEYAPLISSSQIIFLFSWTYFFLLESNAFDSLEIKLLKQMICQCSLDFYLLALLNHLILDFFSKQVFAHNVLSLSTLKF